MRNSNLKWITLLLLVSMLTACRGAWGDNSLGGNLSLLEGDTIEDNVIVYCSRKGNETCISGIYVIPTYERHYENGRYAMYVESARYDKNWIIVKTINVKNRMESYWFINKFPDIEKLNCDSVKCDSILQSHVTGPMDLNKFLAKKKSLNIDLNF